MRAGTHIDLSSWCKSRYFACTKGQGGVGPIETCISGPKVAVLYPKTTRKGWDPWRLVILMLITLFCKQKITGEVWDPQRLVILVLKSLFCMHKTTGDGGNQYSLFILV